MLLRCLGHPFDKYMSSAKVAKGGILGRAIAITDVSEIMAS